MDILNILANHIDGLEYKQELDPATIKLAKEIGAIIVTGYSDDVMVIQGAINDEFYESPLINPDGIVDTETIKDLEVIRTASVIEWQCCVTSVTHEFTPYDFENFEIPHEKVFIKEDGEIYCIGFVAFLADF